MNVEVKENIMKVGQRKRNIGRNITLCGGKIIAGTPDQLYLITLMVCSFLAILIIWTIFVSSLFSGLLGIMFYLELVSFFATLFYYLRCFFSDPGIIPKNYLKYIAKDNLAEDRKSTENADSTARIKKDGEKGVNYYRNIDNENENDLKLEIGTDKNTSKIKKEIQEEKSDPNTEYRTGEEGENSYSNNNEFTSQKKKIVNMFSTSMDDPILFPENSKKKKRNESGVFLSQEEVSDNIPSIFKEKYCSTCNIIRPPAASHCRNCDNCIINLDHHCYFVSNCIGERNHKYFLLFLINGSISGILINFTSIYHFIYVSAFYEKRITLELFKIYPILMTASILSLFFCLLFLWCRCRNVAFTLLPAAISVTLYSLAFYLVRAEVYNDIGDSHNVHRYPEYFNPMSSVVLTGSLPLGIFVGAFAKKQLKLVSRKLTTKQFDSISKELIMDNNPIMRQKFNLRGQLSLSEKIANIYQFLKKEQSPSLISESDIN